jgi:hypothetical protein
MVFRPNWPAWPSPPGIRSEFGSPTSPHEESEAPDAAMQAVGLLARTPDRNRPQPASWEVRTPNPERESRWGSRGPRLFRSGIQIGPRARRQKDYGRSRARNRSCKGGGTFPICLARARRQTPGVLVPAVAMVARGGEGLAEHQQARMVRTREKATGIAFRGTSGTNRRGDVIMSRFKHKERAWKRERAGERER